MRAWGGRQPSFEQLVTEALDTLPEDLQSRMDNVEVVIEQEPPPEVAAELTGNEEVFGLYHGIPLTERSHYDRALPDRISIYEGPLRRAARTEETIRSEVRRTVIHELAHHFGIDDERLEELGWT